MPTAPETPAVSVLMGVLYRREDTGALKRSVDSILNQTFSELEFLICDDGSSPAAKAFLDRTAGEDPRVRLIRTNGRTDLASKLNACFREARGSYLARMDDDDRSLPERFEKQIRALEQHPGIAFVGSGVRLIRSGSVWGSRSFPEFPQVKDFYHTQPFIHPALMFRREALEAGGGYSEASRQFLCEDYDLLLRMYAKGLRGMNLRENLLDYTIPATAKGGRRMSHRWNEAVTRYQRFRELKLLPGAWPYVIRPLAVGLLPNAILERIKAKNMIKKEEKK